jgi:lipoate-protein ligase A
MRASRRAANRELAGDGHGSSGGAGAYGRPGVRQGWTVVEDTGSAAELHERSAALLGGGTLATDEHLIRLLRPTARAVVLGSTQDPDLVDAQACRRRGTEVAKRRSGGGAVLLEPGAQLWVDVVLPQSSPLWSDDVSRASWWLGDLWCRALEAAGAPGGQVWKGPMRNSPWSRLCCFGGTGPGEVFSPAGRKWVGISQRRNRSGAVLQSACLLRWDPAVLVGCFKLDSASRLSAERDLAASAEAVRAPAGLLIESFLAQLPAVGNTG